MNAGFWIVALVIVGDLLVLFAICKAWERRRR